MSSGIWLAQRTTARSAAHEDLPGTAIRAAPGGHRGMHQRVRRPRLCTCRGSDRVAHMGGLAGQFAPTGRGSADCCTRPTPRSCHANAQMFMKRRSTVLGVAAAAGLIAVETVAVVLLMELMPKERCESLYLLGVVAISMIWSRWLEVATSVFSALALAYVDDRPILHFSFDLENALVVGVFLVVALLTNLVANAARARARETAVLAAQQAAVRRAVGHGVSAGGRTRALC